MVLSFGEMGAAAWSAMVHGGTDLVFNYVGWR